MNGGIPCGDGRSRVGDEKFAFSQVLPAPEIRAKRGFCGVFPDGVGITVASDMVITDFEAGHKEIVFLFLPNRDITMPNLSNRQSSPRNSREPLRVLIVEDDPGSRWALGALFKRLGYHCLTAADGDEGLTMVDAFRPQVILTDMMMPGMDGLEFVRQLKNDDRTRSIPVLMLTADATGLGESAARAAGCDGFLPKPIVLAELVSRIQASVRSS